MRTCHLFVLLWSHSPRVCVKKAAGFKAKEAMDSRKSAYEERFRRRGKGVSSFLL